MRKFSVSKSTVNRWKNVDVSDLNNFVDKTRIGRPLIISDYHGNAFKNSIEKDGFGNISATAA